MKPTILFVDDHPLAVRYIKPLLESQFDVQVEHVVSLREAREKVTQNPTGFHVFILDLLIPEDPAIKEQEKYTAFNGISFYGRLPAMLGKAAAPVCVLTHSDNPNIDQWLGEQASRMDARFAYKMWRHRDLDDGGTRFCREWSAWVNQWYRQHSNLQSDFLKPKALDLLTASQILDMLEKHTITASEAYKLLSKIK